MGGKRIDPQTRLKVAELYAQTGNAREVGRELDLPESTVRVILGQQRIARNRALHARAVEAAIRRGRRSLAANVKLIDRYLAKHATDAEGIPDLEPRDMSSLLTAQSSLVDRLLKIEERTESKRMARLTREMRRKEIEIAALRIAAGGVEKHEHTVSTVDARAALAAVLEGASTGADGKVEG
jgi:hypothetical protein